MFVKRD